MVSGDVTYALSTLKRVGFVGGGRQLLLITGTEPAAALAAYQAAILEANDAMEARIAEEVFGAVNGPVPTPRGPMAYVAECEPARALPILLDLIVDGLQRRGISGRLVPAQEDRHPVFNRQTFPALGLLLQPVLPPDATTTYEPDGQVFIGPGAMVSEPIDPHLTETVVDWVLAGEGTSYVLLGATQIAVDSKDVPAAVSAALAEQQKIDVWSTPDDRSRRGVGITAAGLVVHSFDTELSRLDHLRTLEELAQSVSGRAITSLVRESNTSIDEPRNFARFRSPAPLAKAVGFAPLRHLERDFVYDVGVAQVLTSAQLANTSALAPERWHVEPLTDDRHLVAHRDPEAWLNQDAGEVPRDRARWADFLDDEVVSQARADFGEAIMTAETLERHPGPLSPRHLQAVVTWLRRSP